MRSSKRGAHELFPGVPKTAKEAVPPTLIPTHTRLRRPPTPRTRRQRQVVTRRCDEAAPKSHQADRVVKLRPSSTGQNKTGGKMILDCVPNRCMLVVLGRLSIDFLYLRVRGRLSVCAAGRRGASGEVGASSASWVARARANPLGRFASEHAPGPERISPWVWLAEVRAVCVPQGRSAIRLWPAFDEKVGPPNFSLGSAAPKVLRQDWIAIEAFGGEREGRDMSSNGSTKQ